MKNNTVLVLDSSTRSAVVGSIRKGGKRLPATAHRATIGLDICAGEKTWPCSGLTRTFISLGVNLMPALVSGFMNLASHGRHDMSFIDTLFLIVLLIISFFALLGAIDYIVDSVSIFKEAIRKRRERKRK